MSILVNKDTKLLVQGITGKEATFHTTAMVEYGTNVVAGVKPGGAGKEVAGVPVFNTVKEAMAKTGANVSYISVPAAGAADAIYEAADAGIPLIICITEGIPVNDMIQAYQHVKDKGARLIGPNCPGAITPGEAKVGIMPGHIHKPGNIGIVSRSGTLTYEAVNELTTRGLGQSTVVGIGGDPIIGTNFTEILKMFEADPQTEVIVLMGEIGGNEEVNAAKYARENMKKPIIGFIAGLTAPEGKRMGHAGAIISGGDDTAAAKIEAMTKLGIKMARYPAEIGDLVEQTIAHNKK